MALYIPRSRWIRIQTTGLDPGVVHSRLCYEGAEFHLIRPVRGLAGTRAFPVGGPP
jgi:hypothetical protein